MNTCWDLLLLNQKRKQIGKILRWIPNSFSRFSSNVTAYATVQSIWWVTGGNTTRKGNYWNEPYLYRATPAETYPKTAWVAHQNINLLLVLIIFNFTLYVYFSLILFLYIRDENNNSAVATIHRELYNWMNNWITNLIAFNATQYLIWILN